MVGLSFSLIITLERPELLIILRMYLTETVRNVEHVFFSLVANSCNYFDIQERYSENVT